MKPYKSSSLLICALAFLFLSSTSFALTVTTDEIADGAVTNAKISGPISASKISAIPQSQVTGLEAGLAGKSDVTHNHDTLYQQKYGKVAVVAQTGGDYTDPVAAMNDITAWCGTSAATNPCLLKIMPGIYTLGSTLAMASFVDMEGSGANSTKIVGTIRYAGTTNNELRMLAVEGAGNAVEIYGSQSLQIRDASLVAPGRVLDMSYSGSITLKHVNASASDTGIFSYYPYGDVMIEDSTMSAGVVFHGYGPSAGAAGNLYIRNSKMAGMWASVYTGDYNLFVTGSDLLAEGSNADALYCSAPKQVTARESTIKATRNLFLGPGCASISFANTMINRAPAAGTKCFNVYDTNYDQVVCP